KKQEWQTTNQLPVPIEMDEEFQFHSIFVCPVSKEQASEDNPPMLMSCGHVLFTLKHLISTCPAPIQTYPFFLHQVQLSCLAVRGNDVAYCPIAHAFSIVTSADFALIYMDKQKVSIEEVLIWKYNLLKIMSCASLKGHLLALQNFNHLQLNHGLMQAGYVDHPSISSFESSDRGHNLSVLMTGIIYATRNLLI
ncbi:hypothetical protein RYX36_007767, partial [Vicia faba]